MKIRSFAILLTLIPSIALADGTNISGWFDPQPESGKAFEFIYGKDLVIIGENLTGKLDTKQTLPANRQVCFVSELNNNDTKCYVQSDKMIKNWSSNNITFSVPEDIFGAGSVKLRFERYEKSCATIINKGGQVCDDVLKWGDDTTIGNFKLSPKINLVSKDNDPVTSIAQNSVYEIDGAWFGTGKGNIYIGTTQVKQSSIVSWLPSKIVFNSSAVVGTTLRVQSGTSQTSVFDLTQQKGAASSLSTTSSSMSSFPSSISAKESRFSDVKQNDYAEKEISTLYLKGIIQGYSDGTFKPSNTVNRAELLKLLIAGLHASENKGEKGCFPDVSDDWYSPFVCAAKRLGWVAGYASGEFKPASTVNRAEAIKMIVSSLTTDLDSSASLPNDVPADSWFAPYVRKAVELGIVIETSFQPTKVLTRADAAVWIYRGTNGQ